MIIKRFLVSIFLIVFLSSSITLAISPEIKDLDKTSDYAKAAVSALLENKILQGDDNGNINPKKKITRAEIVALLVRALDIDTGNLPNNATFKDVPTTSWAFTYVEAAYRAGIVNGLELDRFGMNETCNREQMAALFVRALNTSQVNDENDFSSTNAFSDRSFISDWAKNEVEFSLKNGLMNGTGANTFSPRGSATREQAAVIIERYLDKKDTLQSAGIKLTFNGDVMPLPRPAIIEGDDILVPSDFLKHFTASMTGYPENGYVCLELAWGYNHLGYNLLWFKAGEATAYKGSGYNLNPFDDPAAFSDRAIALKTAPVLKNKVLYLPLEDICNIVKAEYEYDKFKNQITVETEQRPAYPNLQFALNKNQRDAFRGDAKAYGTMTQNFTGGEPQPDEMIKIDYAMLYRNNELASHTELKYIIEKGGAAPEALTYDKISVPSLNIKYVLDSKAGAWLTTNRDYLYAVSSLTGLNPLVTEKNAFNVRLNQMLISNYSNLPVTRIGTVDIGGRQATKYLLQFDQDSIVQVMDKKNYYGSNLNTIKLYFNEQVSFDIYLYVIGEDIVKQEYHFSGKGREEIPSTEFNVNMDLTIEYQNLGKQLQIELPDGSLVPSK